MREEERIDDAGAKWDSIIQEFDWFMATRVATTVNSTHSLIILHREPQTASFPRESERIEIIKKHMMAEREG